MVDQKIPGERGDPRLKASLGEIERRQVAINFQEYVLREVLGIMLRPGKAIAEAIDTTMVRLHQLRPCERITIQAPPHYLLPVRVQIPLPCSICRPAYPARNPGIQGPLPGFRRLRPHIHVSRSGSGGAPPVPRYGAGCAHATEYAGKPHSVPRRVRDEVGTNGDMENS